VVKLFQVATPGTRKGAMMRDMLSEAFPSPQHNHAACLDDAIRSAREAFRRHDMAFTPLREKVFREIAGSHKAIGAYDVLNSLAKKGTRLTPISVYRAINTLVDIGVVRRFKSRNAYYASHSADPMSPRLVLACEVCGRVADADGVPMFRGIRRALARRAFSPRTAIMEVMGVCAHCAKSNRSARA
jgi:Fur family transcriptional regulator, zinc uptake regulator